MIKDVVKILLITTFLLLLMLVFFHPESGSAQKAANTAVSFILKNLKSPEVDSKVFVTDLTVGFESMRDVFTEVGKGQYQDCFFKINSPDSFKGYLFSFVQKNNDIEMYMFSTEGFSEPLYQENIKNVELCAVYGIGSATHFYRKWIQDPPAYTGEDYRMYDKITLNSDGINIESKDRYFDVNYIYVPENGKACFIPTHGYTGRYKCKMGKRSSWDKGLDNNCDGFFVDNNLKLCGEQNAN